ncbi:transporter substrate-binding domain-containing protein [Vibrio sp. Isolate25]|uniref:substrate-binding periplasmic protein n=1 Tax=Vibrio sp. Isolate25 TaxID=2908535 RepID=UPI001EFC45F4|nr:transporter substrate-binding domain-containing protein [Vibrio sp. Isolate25]MCG9595612.1 transporter substrate-binding domain-containing protein [Vibrio sp. Isolate25]
MLHKLQPLFKGLGILFTYFCLVFIPLSASSQTVTIAVGGEYPPYHSKQLPGDGINAQIVTAAFRTQNVAVKYVYLPTWKEAFDFAAQGKADATALWELNKQYHELFLVSDVVYKINAHFFYKEELEFDWNHIEDLKGLKVSALVGGYYGEPFENAEQSGKISVERVDDEAKNIKKLITGTIDVSPLYIAYVNYVLKKEGLESEGERLAYHPTPLFINTLHLLLPKRSSESKQRLMTFNKGLKVIKKNGKLQAILNAHLHYR